MHRQLDETKTHFFFISQFETPFGNANNCFRNWWYPIEWNDCFFLSYTHSSIHLRHHHIYVFFIFYFGFFFFSLVTHLRTIYINLDEIVFRLRCSLFFRFLFVLLISTIIWHTVRSERFNYFVKLKCTSNTKFHLLTLSTRCHDTHFW